MTFDNDTLFQIANFWVVPGWVLLWFFPSRKWTPSVVMYLIVSLLALLYAILLFTSEFSMEPDSFSSLEGIKAMFGDDRLLVAGWVHYLAFDLTAGLLITRDSLKIGYNFWLRIFVLFFVFMTGPFGMLLYLLTRLYYTRKLRW